jgi:uncharacterized Zn-binding protein involved in type VI secretion
MPGISRIGIDTAGGTIVSNVAPCQVYINGAEAVLQGALILPHGDNQHAAATMVGCSSVVFINGIGVVRLGDAASCGDIATGDAGISAA